MKSSLSLVLLMTISLLFSCSPDDDGGGKDDYGNSKDGFALGKAEGHSFQFYADSKWIFSVAIRDGDVYPALQEGCVVIDTPTFDYDKTDKNEAECRVGISYKYLNKYDGYIARMELTFTSATGGTYKAYDFESDKLKSSGKFTIDSDTPQTPDKPGVPDKPETPDKPEIPETPDKPQIPANLIESKITEVYKNLITVAFTYNPRFSDQITQTGHCWSTHPHPTILDSSVKNNLAQDKKSGTARCPLEGDEGTTYYIRAFAQVGSEFIYFNEMEMQSLGGNIQISTDYSKEKDKIVVDYNINREGTFELHFRVLTDKVTDIDLGFISKGKGQKYVFNYSDYRYHVYLIEVSTGIKYYYYKSASV